MALTLCCYEIENVLYSRQSHQEHRPHCGGDGNQQVARGQQQLLWYLSKQDQNKFLPDLSSHPAAAALVDLIIIKNHPRD